MGFDTLIERATDQTRETRDYVMAEAETALGKLMLEQDDVIPVPVEAFPPRQQEMMHGYHSVYGSSYEHFALTMLTTIATATGNSLQIKHQGASHPASLYSALIAPPGSGKSPIIKTCLRYVFKLVEKELRDYRWDLKQYKESLKNEKGKTVIDEDEEQKPKANRPMVTNFTIERIYMLLQSTPNGMLIYRDELRGWLKSMNQYKQNGDEYEFWLQAADALPFSVDRKGDDVPIFIRRVLMNIIGGIQPGILKSLATQENQDSGMLSRLTVAWPDTQEVRDYNDDEPSPDHGIYWDRMVEMAYSIPQRRKFPEGGGHSYLEPFVIELSTAAKEVFEPYFNALQQRYRDAEDDAEMATISKFRSRSLRLALILHVMEWAHEMVKRNLTVDDMPEDWLMKEGGDYDTMIAIYQPVSGETMQRAVALSLHYENSNLRVIRQTSSPAEALPDHERAWYLSLPEKGKRGEAIDLGLKAGMKERTIDRRLKKRKDLFKYEGGHYQKLH